MRLTEQVHLKLKKLLHPGDTAIDATAGNGHDTLALAEQVGPTGKVIAIDLQAAAIEATRIRLDRAGQLAQCELLQADHADALAVLAADHPASVAAITFNLGYLPGGNKQVTTSPPTTLRALETAKELLKVGGVLMLTAYRGHPGGIQEANQAASWMRALPKQNWQVESTEPPTRAKDRIPPVLWIAQKLALQRGHQNDTMPPGNGK